jgi:hypothetical protein
MNTVKDTASQTLDQVKEQGKSQIAGQKDKAADTISGVAQAMRQTGSNLRGSDQDYVAQFVDQAATRLEEFSSSLRNKDVNELIWEAQGFARRQPALFFGGAFLLGLFAARFFKSAPPDFNDNAGYRSNFSGAGSYGRYPGNDGGSRAFNRMGGQPEPWTGTMPSGSAGDVSHADQGMSDSTDWADRNTPSMGGDNDFGAETGGEFAPPRHPMDE